MFVLYSLLVSLLIYNVKARLAREFIVGGIPTKKNEIKYQVSIQIYGEDMCGGGIIGDQYILTAAHCLVDEDNEFMTFLPLTILTGVIDLKNPGTGKIEVEVIKAYVPAVYNGNSKTSQGDIAVLKLKRKLDLGSHSNLQELLLPQLTTNNLTFENSYQYMKALITGFGWDQVKLKSTKNGNKTVYEETGTSSGKLLKAKALILNNTECQNFYPKYNITNTQICARIIQHPPNVHQGVCSGDSGGPLVHEGTTVVGVVSYNYLGCDDKKRPGVYTRVSSYIDFISNAKKDKVTDEMRSTEWKT